MRVAVVAGPGRTALLQELAEDGTGYAAPTLVNDLPAAVAGYERAGPDRGETGLGDTVLGVTALGNTVRGGAARGGAVRWVWADTSMIYPSLLRSGVRVDRCHDIALTEALLRASAGTALPSVEHPATVLSGAGPLPIGQAALFGQATLFGPAEPGIDEVREVLSALVGAHANQLRRITADAHPARFGLLAAVESAGGLSAAEMRARGMPWRADVHDALLAGLLGPRAGSGFRPPRLAELATQISAAFGSRPVNPDSPAQVLKAFATDGVSVSSTRSGVLRGIDHPAVPLLLEYKELARLHAAHGWSWLDEWVRDGRFHPEYVVGGVVSGRWASRGGGALQIPRVVRRAVVADPGWTLVVADVAQLEPRVLAALAGDHAFAEAAGSGDLYQALAGAFGGDRAKAKVALLSAMYGGAGGEASQLLAVLRRRFPRADAYVEAAARAGEEGRVVRSQLGRSCPPPSAEWRGLTASPDEPGADEQRARRTLRARGRFTRNFVVQASAADWALVLLAGLRRRLAALGGPTGPLDGPGLVFFQHDEVIVHCPRAAAPEVVAAVDDAAQEAGRLVFGATPVRFPVTTAVVDCYADAK
ncbi:MAG: bifunctional 3'-5' exonuclease/DNA polymerase [Streptosporangiaceae bacterium]